ncbi:polysaccharide pyruvyl transferase family protein [Chrysosporum bergii ANA360D]|uniref:Polysaccharide pyruvyl transferase family protein n=1 Tax=Chrysosporum bergii ANA360D TaxID=617107 RepID=A0AA43GR25_9CYAN|nr:polysaccharide pyruvyl transferase family protein [Chrysosporum bergii]MDH6060049.1 polysaccharide pyruvyl transferase family protein [Chrysosporum bergii ANA360D]
MSSSHGIIAGSLNNANMGDHALVKAFINQERENYQKLTILGKANEDLLSLKESIISPPPLAIGYRFWYGYKQRLETQQKINEQIPDARRNYIWLGGLFGESFYHVKSRYQELKWASWFCNKLIYYFGDVHPGFQNLAVAKQLISRINNFPSWIGVRSTEAADLFINAGLTSKVFVGLDAALFQRCIQWGIPFIRQKKDVGAVAIVVCQYRSEIYIPVWRAAAVSAIRLGLKILWISLCDSQDMFICQQLFAEFSKTYPHHPMEIIYGVNGESKIAESSVCVATRFHGAIFSIASGVPTIALPYGAKLQRLFQFLKLDDWIVDPTRASHNIDCNSILYEMIQVALKGNFQPDYSQLETGVKAHQLALENLSVFIKN